MLRRSMQGMPCPCVVFKVRSHGAATDAIFLSQQAGNVHIVQLRLHYFYMVPLLLPHRMGSEPRVPLLPQPQPHSVNNSICYNAMEYNCCDQTRMLTSILSHLLKGSNILNF